MAKPSRADIAQCLTLTPERAIAYLKGKGYAISDDWYEVWQEAHKKAFTVARVATQDILEDIRQAVETSLREGKTTAWFEKELTQMLKAKGWWGRQERVDKDTGEITGVQLGSPWRLETIYRTNLQTAYMAGRYQEQQANVDDRPWWRYVAVLDGRTRASHRALHGKVFRSDDPFWKSFYPPNGWRCRCRVETLTDDEVKALSLKPEQSEGNLGSTQKMLSARNGETREVATYVAIDPVTKKRVIVSPDVGWSYNPGDAR